MVRPAESSAPVHPGEIRKRAVVLLTSPSRRVSLVTTLRMVAESLNVDLRIVACDRSPRKCPACLVADAAYEMVDPDDPAYVDALLEICIVHRVTLILPTGSRELAPLSRSRKRFARIGTEIAVSSAEVVELTVTPREIDAFLSEHGFQSANTCGRAGASSSDGGEPRRFDVLMYFDRHRRLRATIPCERVVDYEGEVLVTRRSPTIMETADRLARVLQGLGSIVSLDASLLPDGSLTIDRIKTYLSESFELAHRAGADIMRWLLREHCFGSINISDEWQDGVEMIRYQAAMFVLPK